MVGQGRHGVWGTLSATEGRGTQLVVSASDLDQQIPTSWLRSDRDYRDELWVFARLGADGTVAALWNAPDGVQRIVALGTGSGSGLSCVLATNAVDFLRLLAIGYLELADLDEEYANPPQAESGFEPHDPHFRAWVEDTFQTSIPTTANEVTGPPALIGQLDTVDPFCHWASQERG